MRLSLLFLPHTLYTAVVRLTQLAARYPAYCMYSVARSEGCGTYLLLCNERYPNQSPMASGQCHCDLICLALCVNML